MVWLFLGHQRVRAFVSVLFFLPMAFSIWPGTRRSFFVCGSRKELVGDVLARVLTDLGVAYEVRLFGIQLSGADVSLGVEPSPWGTIVRAKGEAAWLVLLRLSPVLPKAFERDPDHRLRMLLVVIAGLATTALALGL